MSHIAHTCHSHMSPKLKKRPSWLFSYFSGNPENRNSQNSHFRASACTISRYQSSIDHFLWQTTLPMTGQMGDRDLTDFCRGAPRMKKTRKNVFRKWEFSQIRRCPKSGKSALFRKSQKSQESQLFELFPMWDTVGSPDLPDFPKSMPNLRSEHAKSEEMDDILRKVTFQDTFLPWFSEYSLWEGSPQTLFWRFLRNLRIPQESPDLPDLQIWQICQISRSPDLPDLQISRSARSPDLPHLRKCHFSEKSQKSQISGKCHFSGNPGFPEIPDFPNSQICQIPDLRIARSPDLRSAMPQYVTHMPHRCHWLLALYKQRASSASHLPS